MRHISFIIICLMFVSCRQGIFLQRKYTDGFYFAKASSDKFKDEAHPKLNKSRSTLKHTLEPTKSGENGDTIILVNGKRIACEVKTISRKSITYVDGIPGPVGLNKNLKSSKIASIHFREGQKEYFNQPNQNGNPILQFGLIRTGKAPSNGLAIFGYVLALIGSAILTVIAPPAGIFFLLLNIFFLTGLSNLYYKTLGYKLLNGIGKFYAWLFIVTFIILFIALIIALGSI